jgi:hypothetical protein
VRLAGALGYISLAGSDRLAAVTLGDGPAARLPPLRGKRSSPVWFEWLRAQRPKGEAHLGPALRKFAGAQRGRGMAFLISDLLDPTWEDGVATLASGRLETTVLHLLAPQELRPELEGDLKLVDSEGGGAVEITADYDLLGRYRVGLEAWLAQVGSYCARRDILHVLVDTSLPVETLLLSLLRKSGAVK